MIMMPYGRYRSSLQLTGTQTSGTPQGPSRRGGAIRDRIVAYASFDPSQQAGGAGTAQPPEVTDRGAGPLPPGRQPQGDDVSPHS